MGPLESAFITEHWHQFQRVRTTLLSRIYACLFTIQKHTINCCLKKKKEKKRNTLSWKTGLPQKHWERNMMFTIRSYLITGNCFVLMIRFRKSVKNTVLITVVKRHESARITKLWASRTQSAEQSITFGVVQGSIRSWHEACLPAQLWARWAFKRMCSLPAASHTPQPQTFRRKTEEDKTANKPGSADDQEEINTIDTKRSQQTNFVNFKPFHEQRQCTQHLQFRAKGQTALGGYVQHISYRGSRGWRNEA